MNRYKTLWNSWITHLLSTDIRSRILLRPQKRDGSHHEGFAEWGVTSSHLSSTHRKDGTHTPCLWEHQQAGASETHCFYSRHQCHKKSGAIIYPIIGKDGLSGRLILSHKRCHAQDYHFLCRPQAYDVVWWDDGESHVLDYGFCQASARILSNISSSIWNNRKRIYIAIDGFQQIAEYPEDGIEALLRSSTSGFLPNVYFIFAGSKGNDDDRACSVGKTPILSEFANSQPSLINQDVVSSISLTDGWGTRNLTHGSWYLCLSIYKWLQDGRTWYIQDILEPTLSERERKLTTAEIDDVTLELVNEQEVAFVNYYDPTTDNPEQPFICHCPG